MRRLNQIQPKATRLQRCSTHAPEDNRARAQHRSTAIALREVSKYSQYGYGNWNYGQGLPYERRLDIMPATYN